LPPRATEPNTPRLPDPTRSPRAVTESANKVLQDRVDLLAGSPVTVAEVPVIVGEHVEVGFGEDHGIVVEVHLLDA
jgi:hypothetical protein